MYRRAARNTLWQILAQGWGQLLGFLVNVVFLAGFFPAHVFGQIRTAFAWVELFVVGTDPGIDRIMLRDLSRRPDDTSRFDDYYGLKLVCGVLTGVAIVALSVLLQYVSDYPREMLALLEMLGYGIFGLPLVQTGQTLLNSREQMGKVAMLHAIERTVFAAMVVAPIWIFRQPTMPIAWIGGAYVVGVLAIGFGAIPWIRRIVPGFPRVGWNKSWNLSILKQGFPLGVHKQAHNAVNTLDLIIVGTLGGATAGAYAMSQAVVKFCLYGVAGAHRSLFPISSRNPDRTFMLDLLKRMSVLIIGAVFAAAILGALSHELLAQLFNGKYIASAAIFQWAIWIFPIATAQLWFDQLFETTGHQRVQLVNALLLAGAFFGSIYPLLQRFEAVGAAYALIAAHGLVLVHSVTRTPSVLSRLGNNDELGEIGEVGDE